MAGSNNTRIVTEICVDSIEGVRAAVAAKATRIELCSALLEGGLTPSFGMTKQATVAAGPVGVHVMIRPRGGDFLYSDDEFAAMKDDIGRLGELDIDGFVLGLLTSEGDVDVRRVAELAALCRPATITFHRAFDMAKDPFTSLDTLIDLGVDRLLTSGQAPGVLEGAPLIRDLIRQAAGRIVIMPGGDINARNVARIIQETGADEIHFAAFQSQPSPMRHRNPYVFMGGTLRPPEYVRTVTTQDGISNVIRATRTNG